MRYWISAVDHGGACNDWLRAWTYLAEPYAEGRRALVNAKRSCAVTLAIETDNLADFIECLAPAIEVTVLGEAP